MKRTYLKIAQQSCYVVTIVHFFLQRLFNNFAINFPSVKIEHTKDIQVIYEFYDHLQMYASIYKESLLPQALQIFKISS